ncbi:hypothetical protein BLA29_011810 [Euroglyphus maynei]|uniref:Uncharacterized protein n=1 Tax=Euroglyphus maynei TaxID=6958 RepID=A0A1Y3AUR6_EURMA|nr:hypothetical protein BLA29_011810 [Euroglyphus maynei]
MIKLQHHVQTPSTKDQRTRTTFVELVQHLEKIKEEKLRKNQPTTPTVSTANQSQMIANADNPIGSASVRIPSTHHPMMTPSPHVFSHHHHHPPVPTSPLSPIAHTPYYSPHPSTQQPAPLSPYGETNNPMSPLPYQSPFHQPPPSSSSGHRSATSSSSDRSYPTMNY